MDIVFQGIYNFSLAQNQHYVTNWLIPYDPEIVYCLMNSVPQFLSSTPVLMVSIDVVFILSIG